MGVLAGGILIAGVAAVGTGAHSIDLIHGTGKTIQTGSDQATSGVGATSGLQPGSQTPQGGGPTTPPPGGKESLIGVIPPIAVAAGLGAAFYGFYARRLDAD